MNRMVFNLREEAIVDQMASKLPGGTLKWEAYHPSRHTYEQSLPFAENIHSDDQNRSEEEPSEDV